MTLMRPLMLTMILIMTLCLVLPARAIAQSVSPVPYDTLRHDLNAHITFNALPSQPEPGLNFDAPMRLGHTWLGQHFKGQGIDDIDGFDQVKHLPDSPLALQPGPPGENLSVAHHLGFGSNALFPLGSAGFPALRARGEGAFAILFDQAQRAIGLKVHSDYPKPLGRTSKPGHVTLLLYTRQGALIARYNTPLQSGITKIGVRRTNGLPDIAGVVMLNDDPGGIAIDDILYQTAPAAF